MLSKTICARGRFYINRHIPNKYISMGFTHIQYHKPDDQCRYGYIRFVFIDGNREVGSKILEMERMNVEKYMLPGKRRIKMQLLESGTDVEIEFE